MFSRLDKVAMGEFYFSLERERERVSEEQQLRLRPAAAKNNLHWFHLRPMQFSDDKLHVSSCVHIHFVVEVESVSVSYFSCLRRKREKPLPKKEKINKNGIGPCVVGGCQPPPAKGAAPTTTCRAPTSWRIGNRKKKTSRFLIQVTSCWWFSKTNKKRIFSFIFFFD